MGESRQPPNGGEDRVAREAGDPAAAGHGPDAVHSRDRQADHEAGAERRLEDGTASRTGFASHASMVAQTADKNKRPRETTRTKAPTRKRRAKSVRGRLEGRPRIYFSAERIEQLRQLLLLQCSDQEIARVLAVSEDTLQRRKRDDPEIGRLYTQTRAEGRTAISRALFQQMQDGNVAAAIWLSKQYLGMREPAQELVIQERVNEGIDAGLAAALDKLRAKLTPDEYRRALDALAEAGAAGESGAAEARSTH